MVTKRPQNKPQQVKGLSKGIAIGKSWMVGADSLNIILYRKQVNNKTSKRYWRSHSYHATIPSALKELIEQGVRDTDMADLKTVSNRIDQLCNEIKEVIPLT